MLSLLLIEAAVFLSSSQSIIKSEDPNSMKQSWNISQGINSISTHNYISYFGGQDHFNGTTILQNLYNLQHPHYSVQVDIEMIINEKQNMQLYNQMIKIILTRVINQRSSQSIFNLHLSIILKWLVLEFLHNLQKFNLGGESVNLLFQHLIVLKMFSIVKPIKIKICVGNFFMMSSKLNQVKQIIDIIKFLHQDASIQNFSSEQDSKMLFDYQLQVKSSILVKIRFKLMTLTTASFKVLVDGNIKLEFNYYQVNSYFLYYCYGDYFIYQIEIDTNIYNQDQLQLQINFDFNRWVNIIDFRVYHIQAETWQQPKAIFGCLHALYDQCLMCQEGWIYYPIIKSCQMNLGDENRDLVVFQDDHQSEYSGNITQIQSIPILDQQTSLYLISELIGYKEGGNIINILSICGDGVVGMTEECDDSNQFQFDGCFNCQFSCPLNCQQCNYGKCVTCDLGYELNKYQCTPICGDQLIQQYEICDDGNQIKFDGCYKCQNNCQLECYNCISTYCVECYEGWNLIDGKCEQMCGDEQVAFMSYEQCDNHNDNNCVNCSLKCEYNCQVCLSSQQCVICSYSYQLIDGTCQSVCGDGIVNKEFEDCDDENNIMYDGCFECSLQCSLGCILCEEDNYCKKCDSQFYKLDLTTHLCEIVLKQDAVDNNQNNDNQDQENQNNNLHCNYNYIYVDGQCINQCGNARFQNQYEQCDDGNTIGGDGCSQSCTIENQFVCETIEYQQSECLFKTS